MQNWNPWQTSAGVNPTPPGGYTADPMALMQSYMQYYNQPVSMILLKYILCNISDHNFNKHS